ncbi:unnamed protein product [Rotaria sp. Silwood1]|nr:unnamed protein product [Rotaria sp. Silwood1]
MKDALEPFVPRNTIALINTCEQVANLLRLEKYIDLVIPHASNELVRSIQKQSVQILVLGHAEGICHVFIDKGANLDMTLLRDSICDYSSGFYSGSCLSVLLAFPPSPLANTLHMKYEDLLCCIEIIDDINDPIGHMNKFCSNHTDSIVTKNCNYLII